MNWPFPTNSFSDECKDLVSIIYSAWHRLISGETRMQKLQKLGPKIYLVAVPLQSLCLFICLRHY